MKIACISDTHGIFLPDIPDVDWVIHAGDVGPDFKDLQWLQNNFFDWAKELDSRGIQVAATWGNHDFIGQNTAPDVIYDMMPENVNFYIDEFQEVDEGSTGGEGKAGSAWDARKPCR